MQTPYLLAFDREERVPRLHEFRDFADNHTWEKKREEIFVKLTYAPWSKSLRNRKQSHSLRS